MILPSPDLRLRRICILANLFEATNDKSNARCHMLLLKNADRAESAGVEQPTLLFTAESHLHLQFEQQLTNKITRRAAP